MIRWKDALALLSIAAFGLAIFVGVGTIRVISAQAAKQKVTEAQVLDLQKKFQDASLAADAATVSSLMADDSLFVHSTAALQNKAEYLNSLTSGQLKLTTYQINDPKVVLFDGGAVVSGLTDVGVAMPGGGAPRVLHMRVSTVWVAKPAGWQLILNQGTLIAAPPPAAAH